MEYNNNDSKKNKFMAMVIAFIAGVAAAKLIDRKMRHKTYAQIDELRDEVMRRVRETKDITQEKYNQIVDEMRPKFKAIKKISAKEINDLADELKSHWKNIAQEAKTQIAKTQSSQNRNESEK